MGSASARRSRWGSARRSESDLGSGSGSARRSESDLGSGSGLAKASGSASDHHPASAPRRGSGDWEPRRRSRPRSRWCQRRSRVPHPGAARCSIPRPALPPASPRRTRWWRPPSRLRRSPFRRRAAGRSRRRSPRIRPNRSCRRAGPGSRPRSRSGGGDPDRGRDSTSTKPCASPSIRKRSRRRARGRSDRPGLIRRSQSRRIRRTPRRHLSGPPR